MPREWYEFLDPVPEQDASRAVYWDDEIQWADREWYEYIDPVHGSSISANENSSNTSHSSWSSSLGGSTLDSFSEGSSNGGSLRMSRKDKFSTAAVLDKEKDICSTFSDSIVSTMAKNLSQKQESAISSSSISVHTSQRPSSSSRRSSQQNRSGRWAAQSRSMSDTLRRSGSKTERHSYSRSQPPSHSSRHRRCGDRDPRIESYYSPSSDLGFHDTYITEPQVFQDKELHQQQQELADTQERAAEANSRAYEEAIRIAATEKAQAEATAEALRLEVQDLTERLASTSKEVDKLEYQAEEFRTQRQREREILRSKSRGAEVAATEARTEHESEIRHLTMRVKQAEAKARMAESRVLELEERLQAYEYNYQQSEERLHETLVEVERLRRQYKHAGCDAEGF